MTDTSPESPAPDGSAGTLVEAEGANSGSARSTDGSAESAGSRVSPRDDDELLAGDGVPSGGAGARATPDGETGQGPAAADAELVGAPDTTPDAPGQYAAGSGQDTGSAF